MVDVLREADPTFGRNEDRDESATNDEGFSIDFLRREEAEKFTDAFSSSMTLMHTIDPKTFMQFKEWMSGLRDREALKRNRDKLQALAVKQLLAEGRLTSKL